MTIELARAVHRLALVSYPRRFRRQFAGELDRIFIDRVRRAREISTRRALMIACFQIADAVASGLAERLRLSEERWAWPRHFDGTPSRRSNTLTFDSIRNDLRLAFRQYWRSPMFAILTVASLALGIGANSAMFAVVRGVLLQPLPYKAPDSLVMIWSDNTKAGERTNPVSPANIEAFRAAPSLEQVEALYSFLTPLQVRLGSEPEPALASQVTPDMFALLGRKPLLGQTFSGKDAPLAAVLSHQFWERRMGGDPAVIGRTLDITGAPAPVLILGVMPKDFTFPYGSMLGTTGFTRGTTVDMWLPVTRARDPRVVDASGQPNRSIHYFGVVGRLREGATIERARNDLSAIATQRAKDYPDTNAGWGVTVRALHEQTVGALRPALLLLLAGVGVVLLITCINVANVLLARAAGRGRDLAIRSALGASGRRLIQQTLTESVVLSFAGGIAGLGVMVLATRGILAAAPTNLPRLSEVSPGLPVVLFALALSVVTGLVVGLIPAVAAANSRAQDTLRDGTRSTASPARRRTRAVLIVAEVALAMTLTVCGGLLLRSFVSVLHVDPGFNPEQLLTMQVSVPPRYTDTPSRLTFYDSLENRLRALPGVTALGGTTRLPLGSTNTTTYVDVEGRSVPRAEMPEVEMRRAVFEYFEAMGIPVLRGRAFTREDTLNAPVAAIVNAALAARVFPGEDAVGKRVRFASGSPDQPWMTIVGVVGNIRHASLEEVPKPELYITYRQGPPVVPFLVIRTTGDAADLAAPVRQAMRELGANPPTDIRTMSALRSGSVASRRFVLILVALFGVLALGLAALGVFGVITLIAAERTTEVGIRLALGATPSRVLGLVVGHALKLALAGIAIGAVAALLLRPVLKAQLFGVGAADPLTYVGVALALTITALAAALIPARRAMRVDPAHALRN